MLLLGVLQGSVQLVGVVLYLSFCVHCAARHACKCLQAIKETALAEARQHREATAAAARASDAALESLRTQLAQAQSAEHAALATASEQHLSHTWASQAAVEQIAALQQKVEAAKQLWADAQAECSTEVADLNKQLQVSKQALSTSEAAADQLEQENQAHEKQLSAAEKRAAEFKEKLATETAAHKRLMASMTQLVRRNTDLQHAAR